jgi:phosphatidate cytidylyltransferase
MKLEFIKRILSSIILIPLALFFIIKGSFLFNFFIIICFLITSYEWHLMSKKKPYYYLGLIFLIFSFYTVYELRNISEDISLSLFLFITLMCVSTDIGGYMFGKIFKGPKLTKLSPNKTYSGLIGGYLLSIIFAIFFIEYTYVFGLNDIEFSIKTFIIVFLISTISQIGDIIISYFKRLSKIKDAGKIIPGHGGLLDRIDGMIFVFPTTYLVLQII